MAIQHGKEFIELIARNTLETKEDPWLRFSRIQIVNYYTFVKGNHRWIVDSPYELPVMWCLDFSLSLTRTTCWIVKLPANWEAMMPMWCHCNEPESYQPKHVRHILPFVLIHYTDVIMGTITSQITSLTIVYSTVYSDADQRKYQSSASLAFVRGIHRRPVNSPHKWPVTRKMFPFDDVIM